jgi:hypothetical protein
MPKILWGRGVRFRLTLFRGFCVSFLMLVGFGCGVRFIGRRGVLSVFVRRLAGLRVLVMGLVMNFVMNFAVLVMLMLDVVISVFVRGVMSSFFQGVGVPQAFAG